MPRLEGIDDVAYLNSTTIMELDAVPEHLLIIGGGYVGLEFGQLFRRLGSQVTIVQRGSAAAGARGSTMWPMRSQTFCARMASRCCSELRPARVAHAAAARFA